MVEDVGDGRRPAEAVSGFVAGASGVDDHADNPLGERVLDDEREERLREVSGALWNPPKSLLAAAAAGARVKRRASVLPG